MLHLGIELLIFFMTQTISIGRVRSQMRLAIVLIFLTRRCRYACLTVAIPLIAIYVGLYPVILHGEYRFLWTEDAWKIVLL